MVTKIIKCLLRNKLNVIVEIYRQKVVDFLDLTVLNDIIYVNMALGTSFALYSDNTFFTLQPMYLFELGFSRVRWSSFLHFETYVWIANFINDFYLLYILKYICISKFEFTGRCSSYYSNRYYFFQFRNQSYIYFERINMN